MRDKIVTFRMTETDYFNLRRAIGLVQFQTGRKLSISNLINDLIARYIGELQENSSASERSERASKSFV